MKVYVEFTADKDTSKEEIEAEVYSLPFNDICVEYKVDDE